MSDTFDDAPAFTPDVGNATATTLTVDGDTFRTYARTWVDQRRADQDDVMQIERILRDHLLPFFGPVPVVAIDQMMEAFVAAQRREGVEKVAILSCVKVLGRCVRVFWKGLF